MQYWKKLGLLFDPTKHQSPEWMLHYAAVPFIEKISEDVLRIYFTSRNESNRSMTGWVEYNFNDLTMGPQKISSDPILDLGHKGFFDEDGVMGCHITTINNKKHFYYIGWNRAVTVPFRNAIGLAIEEDNGTYRKFDGPILDRSIYDKCFVASNCVFKDSDFYRMYYLSCDEWLDGDDLVHRYNIKYAESNDGINWKRTGIVAIDYKDELEYAISVPRVIKDGSLYKMWYSYRASQQSKSYRIGYAESVDAINWKRRDDLVTFVGYHTEWDSEMKCYPFIFDFKGTRYMLYNGNGYGKTGFGIAKLNS